MSEQTSAAMAEQVGADAGENAKNAMAQRGESGASARRQGNLRKTISEALTWLVPTCRLLGAAGLLLCVVFPLSHKTVDFLGRLDASTFSGRTLICRSSQVSATIDDLVRQCNASMTIGNASGSAAESGAKPESQPTESARKRTPAFASGQTRSEGVQNQFVVFQETGEIGVWIVAIKIAALLAVLVVSIGAVVALLRHD